VPSNSQLRVRVVLRLLVVLVLLSAFDRR